MYAVNVDAVLESFPSSRVGVASARTRRRTEDTEGEGGGGGRDGVGVGGLGRPWREDKGLASSRYRMAPDRATSATARSRTLTRSASRQ